MLLVIVLPATKAYWVSDMRSGRTFFSLWHKYYLITHIAQTDRFRLIHKFNLALLAKQLWIQFPYSLLARVLRRKYHCICSPLRATRSVSSSYVLTSLMATRPLLTLGIRQIVHLGQQTQVWKDPWIPTIPTRPARPAVPVAQSRLTVAELIHASIYKSMER